MRNRRVLSGVTPLTSIFVLCLAAFTDYAEAQPPVPGGPNAVGTVIQLSPADASVHQAGNVAFSTEGTCTINDNVIITAQMSYWVERWDPDQNKWVFEYNKSSSPVIIAPGQTAGLTPPNGSKNLVAGSYHIIAFISAAYIDIEGQIISGPKVVGDRTHLFVVQ
jgi:hypothetical protein